MKVKFNNWIKDNKSKISKPVKYSSTITTISNHFKKKLNKNIDLYSITNSEELLSLKEEYFSYQEFYIKNKTGNRMYSRALDLYLEFLETNRSEIDSTISEIESIKNDNTLTNLEREAIILSRIGQGKFREQVIEFWKNCAISGYKDSRFLIASHIKPWKKSNNEEKIDKFNGILLLPTYDKLFDLGFITFDNDGKIIISKYLNNYEKLGINEYIIINLNEKHKPYLEYHRIEIFKK